MSLWDGAYGTLAQLFRKYEFNVELMKMRESISLIPSRVRSEFLARCGSA